MNNTWKKEVKCIAESEIQMGIWGILEDHAKGVGKGLEDEEFFTCSKMCAWR